MKVRSVKVCHTCRAKKLGCDGKIPECTQCQIRGRVCRGYEHDLIFKQQDICSSKLPQRLRPASQRGFKIKVTEVKSPHEEHDFPLIKLPISTLPRSSGLSIEDCCALLAVSFAPWLSNPSIEYNIYTPPYQICTSWMCSLPDLVRLEQNKNLQGVLGSAMRTLSISIRSRYLSNAPSAVASEYAKAYGSALGQLRDGIIRGKGTIGLNLMAASMCLNIAELMQPSDRSNWTAHMKGIGNILQAAGPEVYNSGINYKLFAGIRPSLIFEAIESRKSTFLAQENWLTLPYKIYPKGDMAPLLDCSVVVPALLERFDLLKDAQTSSARMLYSEFMEVLYVLRTWEKSYRLEIDEPAYWTECKYQDENDTGSTTYPSQPIIFQSVLVGVSFSHLWALTILLRLHIQHLQHRFPQIGKSSIYGTPSNAPSIFELATWCCRSMSFLMRDEMKLLGPASTLFPLRMAKEAFMLDATKFSRELNWWRSLNDDVVARGIGSAALWR